LKSHESWLNSLEQNKADKRELESLKKFLQNSLQNISGGDVDLKGLDDLDDLLKRIDEVDKKVSKCLTIDDKKELLGLYDQLDKRL